jgi:hypothetical protein
MRQNNGVKVVCTTKARHFCSEEHTEFCVHGAGIVNNLEARYRRRASGCVVNAALWARLRRRRAKSRQLTQVMLCGTRRFLQVKLNITVGNIMSGSAQPWFAVFSWLLFVSMALRPIFGPCPSLYWGFLITRNQTYVGTPLDEGSARRGSLYLRRTKHKNRRWASMPSAGFEHAIPASKRLRTYALDRAATGIDTNAP